MLNARRAILFGTLAVGVLDLLDAVLFFNLTRGTAPIRIFQSIASGVMGRAAFAGGWPAALLGILLHFFIAFSVVLVFFAASRAMPWLRRQWLAAGLLYGIAVYLVMNLIVLPLSAAASGGWPPWDVLVNGLAIHMLGVGLPASLAAAVVPLSPPRRV